MPVKQRLWTTERPRKWKYYKLAYSYFALFTNVSISTSLPTKQPHLVFWVLVIGLGSLIWSKTCFYIYFVWYGGRSFRLSSKGAEITWISLQDIGRLLFESFVLSVVSLRKLINSALAVRFKKINQNSEIFLTNVGLFFIQAPPIVRQPFRFLPNGGAVSC